MGRQGLGHGGIPGGLAPAEGVAEDEQLAHAGDQGHFGRLAVYVQFFVRAASRTRPCSVRAPTPV